MKRKTNIVRYMTTLVLLVSFLGTACAQEIAAKQVTGEVSSIHPRKNPRFIGITYAEGGGAAREMVLFIDKNVGLVHIKSVSDIGIGDSISVTYYEITETNKEGKERTKRVARVVRLVQKADEEKLEKYGLVENPYIKFRREKIQKMVESGELPPLGDLDLTPQEIRELEQLKMLEYKQKGEWPAQALDRWKKRLEKRRSKRLMR
jgi:hypothetical protein